MMVDIITLFAEGSPSGVKAYIGEWVLRKLFPIALNSK
jgi:hypothetical protein